MNSIKALFDQLRYLHTECWKHFFQQNCVRMATALSYQTLLALVPLIILVLSLLTYMDAFFTLQEDIIFFVFDNFLPSTVTHVYDILQDIVIKAGDLTLVGIGGLAITALMLFLNIEASFSQIWQSRTTRNLFKRLIAYLLLLSAGPVALATSLTLVKWVANLTEEATGVSLDKYVEYFNFVLPFTMMFLTLFWVYRLVPVAKVKWTHATIGASIAAALFVAGKYFFKLYLLLFPSYEMIYGALSILPLFLIWIFVSWVLVLFGASITAVLGFNYTGHMKHKENAQPVDSFPSAKA